MADFKKINRLKQARKKNYEEIGKLCTEIQYWYCENERHVKLPFLQFRLKQVLETNVKLTYLIKKLEVVK